jgi:hypothetical protein
MDIETISQINILFDDTYKTLIEEFKEKHYALLMNLKEDWYFGVDRVQKLQADIRDLLPEIFEKCNLFNPNKPCGMPEIYATFLALISPLSKINCWKDFNIKNDFMEVREISEKITDELDMCICCCGKTNCEPTNMGQVWHKEVKQYIMVGSSCITKKELLDCDLIQKAHAKLERKKKKEAKAKAQAEIERLQQEEIKKKEIRIKQRESKIKIVKQHTFHNMLVEDAWKWHDFIQLYYDNKCDTDYDNKLDKFIMDIKQGKYSQR